MSCVNDIVGPYGVKTFSKAVHAELTTGTTSIDLAWTDITWLLYARHISWRYYVQTGTQPDCASDSAETCAPVKQSATTPGIWNPLPLFGDVHQDHQLNNIQSLSNYFTAARTGSRARPRGISPVSSFAPANAATGRPRNDTCAMATHAASWPTASATRHDANGRMSTGTAKRPRARVPGVRAVIRSTNE